MGYVWAVAVFLVLCVIASFGTCCLDVGDLLWVRGATGTAWAFKWTTLVSLAFQVERASMHCMRQKNPSEHE